jgi:small GTP-binding protein
MNRKTRDDGARIGLKWKVVMLGDFAVGKTSLVRRFVHDDFSDAYLTTLGVKVTKKNVSVKRYGEDLYASLMLWDISGNDRFNEISPDYIRGAAAGVIAGDVTRPETVASMQAHLALLHSVNPRATCAFVLNKVDLADDRTWEILGTAGVVPGENWYRTSAKDGRNVNDLFDGIAARLIEEHP